MQWTRKVFTQVSQDFSMQRMLTCYDPLTVQIIKPRHLGEDYPTTMFFEKRKFSIFFCIQTNNIKIFNNCSSFINCLNFPYLWGNCSLYWLISINPNSCEFLNRLRMIFLDTLQSENSSFKIVVSCTMSFYKPNIKLRLNQKVDIYNDNAHCYSHLFASLVLPYTPMSLRNHTNNGCEWSESQPTLFLKSYKESNLTPTKIVKYGSGNTLRTMYPLCCFFKLQLYVFTNSQKSG